MYRWRLEGIKSLRALRLRNRSVWDSPKLYWGGINSWSKGDSYSLMFEVPPTTNNHQPGHSDPLSSSTPNPTPNAWSPSLRSAPPNTGIPKPQLAATKANCSRISESNLPDGYRLCYMRCMSLNKYSLNPNFKVWLSCCWFRLFWVHRLLLFKKFVNSDFSVYSFNSELPVYSTYMKKRKWKNN